MREQQVIIEGNYDLAGTLTLPQEEQEVYPLMVMVHGSGDLDRDENTKHLRINTFKEISDFVVKKGIATLRYDKRGVGESEGDFYKAGLFDLIEDAISLLRFGKNHPQVDAHRIILLGHSEGSIIAPAIHAQEPVSGMVLLAGTAEPLSETTTWQREKMKEDIKNAIGFEGWLLRLLNVDRKIEKLNRKVMDRIENSTEDVIRYRGKKINAKWDREHRQYNIRDYLPQVECPVLAITGTKDVQVKPWDLEEIAELSSGPCDTHLIEDMSHILRRTNEQRFSKILKDYKRQVKEPIDQEVLEIIGEWLEGNINQAEEKNS
ncbi:alpha/beta hydrolase family protein [Virgibacillus xinjiangensis]|uniref:Alpha/beta hydrolase family protein n=1 Tax=Virgibacillus xinjiangensis TaxID=393090 RepID=A0ABV7CW64_9BACI